MLLLRTARASLSGGWNTVQRCSRSKFNLYVHGGNGERNEFFFWRLKPVKVHLMQVFFLQLSAQTVTDGLCLVGAHVPCSEGGPIRLVLKLSWDQWLISCLVIQQCDFTPTRVRRVESSLIPSGVRPGLRSLAGDGEGVVAAIRPCDCDCSPFRAGVLGRGRGRR